MKSPDSNVRRVMVFSHPNHELAVFGFVMRHRPRIVFLTDGGGEARVAQTRRGLASIGALDRATFLDFTEKSFYDALLERDTAFFRDVVERLRSALGDEPFDEVLCDAIEYYNPVHDICRPIVAAAFRERTGTAATEIPLIYQTAEAGERYAVQRMPASRGEARRELLSLRADEVEAKMRAANDVYTMLRDQLGAALQGMSAEHFSREECAAACAAAAPPAPDQTLRYEWRAEELRARGEIERVIKFADHFMPVASALFA